MKRLVSVSLLTLVLLGMTAGPGHAWTRDWHPRHGGGRAHVFIGVGPAFGWGPWPYPYWDYPPPSYVYAPPPVVIEEPPVYVQPPTDPAAPEAYWYYCPRAPGYYPSVPTCPEAWIKVPPRPE